MVFLLCALSTRQCCIKSPKFVFSSGKLVADNPQAGAIPVHCAESLQCLTKVESTQHHKMHNQTVVPHQKMHNHSVVPHQKIHNHSVVPHQKRHNQTMVSHQKMHNQTVVPHQRMHNHTVVTHPFIKTEQGYQLVTNNASMCCIHF